MQSFPTGPSEKDFENDSPGTHALPSDFAYWKDQFLGAHLPTEVADLSV